MQKGNVVLRKAKREHNGNGAGGNMSVCFARKQINGHTMVTEKHVDSSRI